MVQSEHRREVSSTNESTVARLKQSLRHLWLGVDYSSASARASGDPGGL